MSVIDWALVLIWVAAPPQTLFVLVYGTTNHWWRSWIGVALLVKAAGLMMLLDVSLLEYYYPKALPPWVTNVILGFVAVGATLQLYALILDKYPGSRRRWWWLRSED